MSRFLRGDVWLVDLGMAAKVRPCLVVSIPPAENERALIALVPHTTSLRGSRFECNVPAPFLKQGAFDVQGLVTVPFARLVRRLGVLSGDDLARIETVLRQWLALEP